MATRPAPNAPALSSWEQIQYDQDDNRTSELVSQTTFDGDVGTGVGSFTYDALGRLTSASAPLEGGAEFYGLDDAGNVINDSEHMYTYVANRLTERVTQGSNVVTTFRYDEFGNQIGERGPGGELWGRTYDAAGQPRRNTALNGDYVEYAYDAFGRLAMTTTQPSGEIVLHFHDRGADQVTIDVGVSGTNRVRYVLDSAGGPIGNEDYSAPVGQQRAYFVLDPRGNVVQMLDGTGQVVATYDYDAFGEAQPAFTKAKPRAGSSDWDSRLRFQRSPIDPKTKTYALGSRLYDPSIQRFLGADSMVGSSANLDLQTDPLTGNRYLYAGANPANLVDDGHAPSGSKSVTFDIPKRPEFGTVRIALFISTCTIGFGTGRGDCRRFNSKVNRNSESRVYLELNYTTGNGYLQANESCTRNDFYCRTARDWHRGEHGRPFKNRYDVTVGKDDSVTIWIDAQNSITPTPSIDVSFMFNSKGELERRSGDSFPSIEVYRDLGGKTTCLWKQAEKGYPSTSLPSGRNRKPKKVKSNCNATLPKPK